MKKAVKLMALVMVLALCLALTACGGNKEGSAPAEDSAITTVSEGQLIMATNAEFPPYEYYDNNEVVGVDAEVAQAIADKLGLELVISDMDFDSVVTSVSSGKADMALAGLTILEERKLIVDFTTSYCKGVQVIIVPEDSPITTADDLFGDQNYTIGVQLATTGDLYCTWDIEDEGLGTVDRYNKGADAVMALKAGKVDCVVIDNQPAKVFVAQNEGLKILDTEYVEEDYAIALNKENKPLYDAVEAALQELIAYGTIQTILDKYISAE